MVRREKSNYIIRSVSHALDVIEQFFGEADGFLTVTPFRFRIADVHAHFHLPLKFTRWGYSLFRGA